MSEIELNDGGWRNMIDGDLKWLDGQPDSLEKHHIKICLNWLLNHQPSRNNGDINTVEKLTDLIECIDNHRTSKVELDLNFLLDQLGDILRRIK